MTDGLDVAGVDLWLWRARIATLAYVEQGRANGKAVITLG